MRYSIMSRKVGHKLKRFSETLNALEGVGPYVCMFDELRKREVVRKVMIRGRSIYVRTNTVDLDVAVACLYHEEFGHVRLPSPKFIVDAGANIGASTIFFSERYPDAQIIAIEPEENNFDLLKKNIESRPNIDAMRAALWGYDDKRKICNRHTGNWGYTVAGAASDIQSTAQEIDCVSITSLMKKYDVNSIDLLKMDIEGSEKNVFEHSSSWIDTVKVITVELHDKICEGCTQTFYSAASDFQSFEKHGEKVTAYKI